MRVRLNDLVERARVSLFFLPMVGVLGAVALGGASLALDRRFVEASTDLPIGLVSTVDAARAVLSTVAGATITFASIAFSVALLIIQQASSQYSPRVVHTLFRDPFNKRVMGLVVGTFTFCVVVLRSVRTALEQGGDPIVPNVSVALAVVLGIATILAIVAFINHSAHSMDVSEILERVRVDTIEVVQRTWREHETDEDGHVDPVGTPSPAVGAELRFRCTGWIRRLDIDALFEAIEPGHTLHLEMTPGRYAIAGTILGHLEPRPEDLEAVQRAVNAAVVTGTTRTTQQDAAYGLRQLADVALTALSPGVNDPTTAQDAIFHSAAVLVEMLRRDPPLPTVMDRDGKRVIAAENAAPAELVRLAFAETRRAAVHHPAVCVYLLSALAMVAEPITALDLDERTAELSEQAALVVDGCRAEGLLPDDLLEVEDAYRRKFPAAP